MKKLALVLAVVMVLSLGLTACGTAGQNPAPAASPTPAGDVQGAETPANTEGFPFTLTTKDGQEVTFTHVPETIISCNPNAGDELMALGLGDKIIATAYNNTQVNPQWREEYEAIPTVAESYISLETILSLEPDFVYGRSSSFSEKNNTTHDTLSGYGIMSLSSIEGYTVGADVDVVYQDFYNLGRIFQVEDKAEEIVSGMKGKITAAKEFGLHPETFREYLHKHEPELANRQGMVQTSEGKRMSRQSKEKYAEAIRLYGTTTETLKDIATRLGLTYNSIGGYIRRNHPEVINAHSTLLIEKDEKSVITSK